MINFLFSYYTGIGVIFLFGYIFYFVFWKPLSDIRFYKKQGIKMNFFPFLGTIKMSLDSLSRNGDFYGYWVEEVKKDPTIRAFGANFLSKPQLCLIDTKLIKEFFQKQEYYIKIPFMNDLLKIITGEGLAMSEGEFWRRHRRVIGAAFRHEFLRDNIPDMITITNQLLDDMKKKDLNDIKILREFEVITGEIVGRLFFGEKFSDDKINGQSIISMLSDMIIRGGAEGSSLFYILFGIKAINMRILPRHKKLMKDWDVFDKFTTEIIEKKKSERINGSVYSRQSKPLIDILLEQNDQTKTDAPFSTQEIIDEFKTFVAAGMATTAILIGMATFYLHRNPQCKPKLMGEVEKYFKEPSQVTLETLNQMEYMTAFMKETLRFVPASPGLIMREAMRDHTLGDLQIKKGTVINIGILPNNFNPIYHDDEEIFEPERWIVASKTKESVAKDPYVYIPFSSGPRNCIGQHLALNEARIIFSLFLKKYDFVLDPNYKHKMTQGLVYEPVQVMSFKLTPEDH